MYDEWGYPRSRARASVVPPAASTVEGDLIRQGYSPEEARRLVAKYQKILHYEGEALTLIKGVPTRISKQAYEILKREGFKVQVR